MKSHLERFEELKKVEQSLKDSAPQGTMDSYLFIGTVANLNFDGTIVVAVGGDNRSIVDSLMATLRQPGFPDKTKKAFFTAIANVLSDYDDAGANIIAKGLGVWTEEKFGKITCNCPKCLARRSMKNNIHVN